VQLSIKPVPTHLRTQSMEFFAGFWILWVMFPLIAVFSGCFVLYRQIHAKRHRMLRRKSALKRAQQRLMQADTGDKIARIVYAYIADQHNLANHDVTHNNWLEFLPVSYNATTLEIHVDEARGYQFAPSSDHVNLRPLAKRIAHLLNELDDIWQNE
ncbi:MAG: hypothetical protein D6711_17735, partial [Chloroflexi bacterium]